MVGSLALPGAVQASTKGKKNTAIGLGAAAAHQILTGKTTNGVLLGAGAAYAYKKYKDADKEEKARKRSANYRTTTSSGRYGGSSSNMGKWVYTGRISDDTDLVNRVITVDHSGVDRRTEVPRNATLLHAGAKISVHDLREGDMVRVNAVKIDEDRYRATRIDVLNASAINDMGRDRDRTDISTSSARYSGVGIVQSVSSSRTFIIRAGSNTRTIYADDASFEGVSSASSLREGDRVRVTGNLDGKNVNASEVILLD